MNRGFTLIEIMVSIGILVIILSVGLFISFDFYRGSSFRSEKEVIVSALQKARSQAMNNIDQVRHGVHFPSGNLEYIIFECPSGTPSCTSYTSSSSDISIKPSYGVNITSPALPTDIIFEQLSGECVNCDPSGTDLNIVVSDNLKNFTISVNKEGRINW